MQSPQSLLQRSTDLRDISDHLAATTIVFSTDLQEPTFNSTDLRNHLRATTTHRQRRAREQRRQASALASSTVNGDLRLQRRQDQRRDQRRLVASFCVFFSTASQRRSHSPRSPSDGDTALRRSHSDLRQPFRSLHCSQVANFDQFWVSKDMVCLQVTVWKTTKELQKNISTATFSSNPCREIGSSGVRYISTQVVRNRMKSVRNIQKIT
ncbi:PREDICTED: uncharacterized protein LOC109158733 [Ipomoea nil]|uniref:uncharacterized protein LOC109158733 n=1 Tax=Ipomoea nil TaxID=35883 RepID=UPI000901859E|nr:PREDICTED: uncharacterized protein LOC109158733 [Ipomoea nil]